MENRLDLLQVFRAGWWILPLVVAAALGGTAYLNSGESTPVYRTRAELAVVPDSTIKNDIHLLRGVEVLERRTIVSTLSRIPTSGDVRKKAADRMGTRLRDLRGYRVRTSILPNTHLIRVTVRGPDPKTVARLADAITSVSEEEAGSYYRVFRFRLLDGPGVRGHPVNRGDGRSYTVAGVVGLFLGLGASFGVGMIRRR